MRPNIAGKIGWMLGAIPFVAFGVAAAQTATNNDRIPAQTTAPAVMATATSLVVVSNCPGDTNPAAPPRSKEASLWRSVETLSEVYSLANDMNAVFVFVPGTNGIFGDSPFKAINNAKQSLETRFAIKIGVFALKPGSPDYRDIAAQMSVPGVVAIVKTGAKARISGDLTEEKIVDGFLAAVGSGGCCPLGEPSDSK